MSEYKLVPVEPTLDMMWAAQEADMDHSDHDEWLEIDGEECKRMYKSMLAAAPAVQGEPVAWLVIGEPFDGTEGLEAGDWDIEPVANLIDHLTVENSPARIGLYAASQPTEQQPFEWPLLDAPALIGGVVVGKGCSTGTVVAIAKRKHQYEVETSPEERARRGKAFKDVLARIHEGIGQQPAEQRCEYCDGTGDVHSLDGEFRGTCSCPAGQQPAPEESLSAADCQEVLADHRRLARELDVLLNGEEGAAKQASLCDLLGQLRSVVGRTGKPVLTAPDVAGLVEALEGIAKLPIDPCSTENDYRLSAAKAIANAALAPYRKGGDV